MSNDLVCVPRGSVCESHDLLHGQLQRLRLQRHRADRRVGREEVPEAVPWKQVTQTVQVQEHVVL